MLTQENIIEVLDQTKIALAKKLSELPIDEAYKLLDDILKSFVIMERYAELEPEDIVRMKAKPMSQDLSKRFNSTTSKWVLRQLCREHVQYLYEYRCSWLDYLCKVTDKKPKLPY